MQWITQETWRRMHSLKLYADMNWYINMDTLNSYIAIHWTPLIAAAIAIVVGCELKASNAPRVFRMNTKTHCVDNDFVLFQFECTWNMFLVRLSLQSMWANRNHFVFWLLLLLSFFPIIPEWIKKKNIADRAHARIFTEKFTHGQTSKACFFFGFLMRLFLVESIVGVILSNPNPKNYTLPAIWLTMIKNRDFPLVRPSSNWYSRQANGTRNVNFTLAKNGFLVFSFSFETHLGRCSVFVCSCVWVMCGEAWN